jgi:hypothetical protein
VSPRTSGSCSNVLDELLVDQFDKRLESIKKNRKTRKLKSIHEQHFVERKNRVKKPAAKNSSKRRLSLCPETSTKNAVCRQYSIVPKLLEEVDTNVFSLHIPHIQFKMRRADYTFETRLKANTIS